MRTLFVVNPAAGNGRARRVWAALEPDARRLFSGSDVAFTQAPGGAEALARAAGASGADVVVAAGGDGTVSEVLAGLMAIGAARRPALGLLPLGSGCDTARHFGLAGEARQALARLDTALPRPVDVGLAEWSGGCRHFLNVVTLGLGGEVGRKVAKSGKPLGGTLSYLAASLIALWEGPAWTFAVSLDDRVERPRLLSLIGVCNTSTTGGGMRIAPYADAADGRLDVVLVDALPRWQLLRRLPSVYWGAHVGAPGVRLERAATVGVDGPPQLCLNLDGEPLGRLPARFSVLPGALQLLA